MAGEIAIELANILLGLGNIGTGIGFTAAEKKKMEDLDTKAKKLEADATTAGTLYDDVFYVVTVNLNRVKKSLDKLPTDMLDNIEVDVSSDLQESSTEEAIQTVATVLGYSEQSVKVLSDLIKVVGFLRFKKGKDGYIPLEEEDEFEMVPVGADGDKPPPVKVETSSLPTSAKLNKLLTGLSIAGLVFGVAGLATTVGLGVWTLEKLDKAISDVNTKQAQVDAFQTAMKKSLDEVVTAAGLSDSSYPDYSGLVTLASTWKTMAEDFESYQKAMYYAIKNYYDGKTDDEVKTIVEANSDEDTTFPDDGYSLAKTLAEAISTQLQSKTDKEVVDYFANDYPDENQRFVLDEYFVSSLSD